MGHSHNRFLLTASGGEPSLLSRQVSRLRVRRRMGGLGQASPQDLLAFAGLARMAFARTGVVARGHARPGRQRLRSGEAVHVRPHLRHDRFGGLARNAGKGIQQRHRLLKRAARWLDLLIKTCHGFLEAVDLAQQLGQHKAVLSSRSNRRVGSGRPSPPAPSGNPSRRASICRRRRP